MSRALPGFFCAFTLACTCSPWGTALEGSADSGRTDGGEAGAGASAPCTTGPMGPGSVVGTGLDTPRRLATDGVHLYFTLAGLPTQPSGRVVRVLLLGGLVEPVTDGLTAPDALAVDATDVYVLDADGVWRAPKSGGSKVFLASVLSNSRFGGTTLMVAGEALVVAAGFQYLLRLEKDGTSPVELFAAEAGALVRSPVIEGNKVFFLLAGGSANGIYEVLLDGSAPATRVLFEPSADGRGLHLTPTRFVWTERGGGAGRVCSADRTGGTPVVHASELLEPTHPVVVGEFIYFKDSTAGTGTSDRFFQRVQTCSSPGTSEPVGPQGVGPGDLLFVDGVLFFTSSDSSPLGYVGRVP
ncbi:MAG: hypothetical protein ACOZIN_11670 [Myxococcota bacterium]